MLISQQPPGNRALLDGYLDNLITQRKLSPHTVRSYGRDLAELSDFAEALAAPSALDTITHFHIRKFASQLHARGLNARSIARKLSAWRGFFAWLSEQT